NEFIRIEKHEQRPFAPHGMVKNQPIISKKSNYLYPCLCYKCRPPLKHQKKPSKCAKTQRSAQNIGMAALMGRSYIKQG
ncbi:hypothetical protein, partial [Serratia marcescens]|uniref:hypothetical protein n=1 Tax=Serratia marcescens TaxID=615 RepID=UPI001C64685E